MNGNVRGNALVSGIEDKMSLAGSSRKVPIAGKESELGGQLGQRYPVVSTGHMQVTRVTSGRSWPVYCAEKSGLILSISQLLSHLCLHTHSPSRWFFFCQNQKRKSKIWALWHFGDVKSENAGQQHACHSMQKVIKADQPACVISCDVSETWNVSCFLTSSLYNSCTVSLKWFWKGHYCT